MCIRDSCMLEYSEQRPYQSLKTEIENLLIVS
jgi:hypothetical protein